MTDEDAVLAAAAEAVEAGAMRAAEQRGEVVYEWRCGAPGFAHLALTVKIPDGYRGELGAIITALRDLAGRIGRDHDQTTEGTP